jgi:TolB-like protein/Tfp pilus assembly protein PilF
VRERSGAGGPAGGTLPALGPIQEKSIAVLAFADMSEKKDQEFFSDGLAEQLLDQLTSIPELKVIARTSSFYFKGKDVPLEEIGRQLRVANILQGSVRRSGNHLRVTTQLVRADSGVHLWSQTYDRQMKDIFQVQDDIAAAVVGALKVKLAAGQTITTVGTRNPEAYTQFILARQTQARAFDAESYGKAVEAFKKAIALDPKYADAFAGMAHAKAFTADALGDTGKGIDEALADAENAVALGPDRPYPYWIRAYIREGWRWDWAGATDDIEKAVALDAGDAGAWATRATMLEDQGRLTEALADNRRAIELSPLGGRLWSDYAMALVATGQYATAHEAFARALQIQPTLGNEAPSLIFVLIQLHESKFGDALATARKIGTEEIRLPSIAMVECSLHHAEESRRALQEAEAKFAKAQAYQIAEAHAWCEDANQGFKWLDRAYRQRDGGLSAIKWDPAFNSLRGDPRYAALLRKMNFPEGNATH